MTKEIPLTQGKTAIVDDDMYEYLNQWKWCAHKHRSTFYAVRGVKLRPFQKIIKMHRLILNDPIGLLIDHQDGNGLNNTRENLRICTNVENLRNRGRQTNNKSGFKGVSWNKNKQKYHARIKAQGKYVHIGYYDNPIDAAKAYDEAAMKYFWEFARTNF